MFKRNSEFDALRTALKSCPLFEGLKDSELKIILDAAHVRDYSEGEAIFNEGTIGLCFYLIVKGSAKIVTEGNDSAAIVVRELSAGDYFSEVHLFAEIPHTVSCIATGISRLIVIAKPDLEDIVKINSRLGSRLLLSFLGYFGEKLDAIYSENKELKLKLSK
jgi:CRP/FNR family transcriptional regulator, cyclic AMP receptor protein